MLLLHPSDFPRKHLELDQLLCAVDTISGANDTPGRAPKTLLTSIEELKMSNPTAARWFARDNEFFSTQTDYAFPGRDSAAIKRELRNWDVRLSDDLPWTYYGYVRRSDSNPCYRSATQGALVFADVVVTGERKELVKNIQADNELPKDKLELVKQQERTIREKLAKFYRLNPLYNLDVLDEDDANGLSDKEHARVKQSIRNDGAYLYPEIVNFILSRQTPAEKMSTLRLYSGEGRSKHPRHTIMLIEMVDDAKATRCGESSGYVIAYDFLTDMITIKQWLSSPDHHPLQDPWSKLTNDGVSWTGHPSELLHQIVSREGLVREHFNYGFALLMRFMAGRWLSCYFEQLGLSSTAAPDGSHYVHAQLGKALSSYAAELDKLDVPGVETDSEGRKKATNYRKPRSSTQEVYGEMIDYLESREVDLAEIAVEERNAGKSMAAENLAKFYDGVSRAARALLVEPDVDFSFERRGW